MRWIIGLTAILTCAACGWAFASDSGVIPGSILGVKMENIFRAMEIAAVIGSIQYTDGWNKKHPEWTGENVKGIAGWLLLFILTSCVSMLFVVYMKVAGGLEITEKYAIFKAAYYMNLLPFAAFTFFFCFCIYRLLSYHKNAIKLIKIFLVLNLVLALIDPILLIMPIIMTTDLPMEIIDKDFLMELYSSQMTWIILGGVPALIWFSYFCVSKRVKNTWSDPAFVKQDIIP